MSSIPENPYEVSTSQPLDSVPSFARWWHPFLVLPVGWTVFWGFMFLISFAIALYEIVPLWFDPTCQWRSFGTVAFSVVIPVAFLFVAWLNFMSAARWMMFRWKPALVFHLISIMILILIGMIMESFGQLTNRSF